MIPEDMHVHTFRHYIYGISNGVEDFFLDTKLSLDGARKYAKDHQQIFKNRFTEYSIRVTDREVQLLSHEDLAKL